MSFQGEEAKREASSKIDFLALLFLRSPPTYVLPSLPLILFQGEEDML